jgi:cell division protein FtsI (penicillin-binding protein 3)
MIDARESRRREGRIQRVRLEGAYKQALETGRNRLLVTAVVFGLAFLVIAGRLIDLADWEGGTRLVRTPVLGPAVAERADIIDRNGLILATSLPTASLFADPSFVPDAEEAADKLVRVLPGLDRARVLAKLKSKGRFVWLRRNLTPNQQYAVNRLGVPGFAFQRGERRVYPHGREAAHVLGYTDVDGRGISGMESYFDAALKSGKQALRLSIDLRIQSMVRQEIMAAMVEFRAKGAAGVVMNVNTSEVLAMVSLPDFDPNMPTTAHGEPEFNRAAKGIYEMGSTFKLFTTAMALDGGTVTLEDGYDASQPIRIALFTIADYHAKNRWLSVPEILFYSSNIGAAKMAVDVGAKAQRDYLGRLGLLHPPAIELPEVGSPLTPAPWRKINTMTIAYGHGIAVSPLQVTAAVSTVVNGGIRRPPTLLYLPDGTEVAGDRALSAETSRQMAGLMRLVVSRGTGRRADVPGYQVGGKTGTADKVSGGSYRTDALISSFVAAFPMDRPRYVVIVMLDEPKGNASTNGYATGGWVAAPAVGRIVKGMAPLTGILPGAGAGKPEGHRLASLAGAPAKAREKRRAAR